MWDKFLRLLLSLLLGFHWRAGCEVLRQPNNVFHDDVCLTRNVKYQTFSKHHTPAAIYCSYSYIVALCVKTSFLFICHNCFGTVSQPNAPLPCNPSNLTLFRFYDFIKSIILKWQLKHEVKKNFTGCKRREISWFSLKLYCIWRILKTWGGLRLRASSHPL